MRAELPLARAKLERLIESRAQTLAEEMYVERIRVEAEAVRAEFTVPPEEDTPAPQAPPSARPVDPVQQVAEEQRRAQAERLEHDLGIDPAA